MKLTFYLDQVCGRRPCVWAIVLASLPLINGCSTVSVVKVDSQGKKICGAVEGVPFYLSRPYIDVFEPFVVDTKIAWAEGELTPDGKYVRLTLTPELRREGTKGFTGVHFLGSNTVYVSSAGVGLAPAESPAIGALHAGTAGGPAATSAPLDSIIQSLGTFASALGKSPSTNQVPGTSQSPTNKPPSTKAGGTNQPAASTQKAGTGSLQVENKTDAWTMMPTRRFFDIIWLQDFEERYVVEPSYRMGSLNSQVTLGQGWSLQGLNLTVDNSGVVQPLLDFYGSSLETLSAALQTAAGAPPVANLAKSVMGALHAGGVTNLAEMARQGQLQSGAPITLKVTIAKLVAPGLYPILKPKERELYRLTVDTKQFDDDGNYYAPKPPVTAAVFKTYPVLVLEAVIPSGDSPLNFTRYKSIDVTNSTPTGGAAGGARSPSTSTSTSQGVQQSDLDLVATNAFAVLTNTGVFKNPQTGRSALVGFRLNPSGTGNKVNAKAALAIPANQLNNFWPSIDSSNAVLAAVKKELKTSTISNLDLTVDQVIVRSQ